MQTIIVASTNPVKLEATRLGFRQMFPDTEFELSGLAVPSGVSNQPMSRHEAYQGALNRARNIRQSRPDSNFAVGIEGGLEEVNGNFMASAWVVILSGDKMGRAQTGSFYLPDEVAALVRQGHELGDADDIVFGKANSKQQNGAVGLLTGDAITRATLYMQAVVMALIPFKNPSLTWNHS